MPQLSTKNYSKIQNYCVWNHLWPLLTLNTNFCDYTTLFLPKKNIRLFLVQTNWMNKKSCMKSTDNVYTYSNVENVWSL